jgi:phenylpyruvate tautomerase PptA (4-oxalocrotonate tautomerase family)
MPVITINTLELTDKQKRNIAKKFTKILSDSTKVPEDRIYILFNSYPLSDIAAGGVLNCDLDDEILLNFDTKYTEELRKKKKK